MIKKASEHGVDADDAVADQFFRLDSMELKEHYDFHEPMKTPIMTLTLSQAELYKPMNIEFTQKKQLAIEGSMMDMQVRIYEVKPTEADAVLEPVEIISTGCRGLSA